MQMFQSEIFEGENEIKKGRTDVWKMSSQTTRSVPFIWKKAELIGAVSSILECIAEPMQITKNLSKKAGLSKRYKCMSLRPFMAWVQSIFPGYVPMKVSENHKHGDPISNYPISDHDWKDQEE